MISCQDKVSNFLVYIQSVSQLDISQYSLDLSREKELQNPTDHGWYTIIFPFLEIGGSKYGYYYIMLTSCFIST